MGFLAVGKKKAVPDELPELISDEIEKESSQLNDFLSDKEKNRDVVKPESSESAAPSNEGVKKEEVKTETAKPAEPSPAPVSQVAKVEPPKTETPKSVPEKEVVQKEEKNENVVKRLIKGVEETPDRKVETFSSKKSFFVELGEKISSEMDDVDSLEEFVKDNLNSENVFSEMKNFWNKEKNISEAEKINMEFKEKISQKISILQELEKDWQKSYFDLMEKEDKIKNSEAELKDLLNEFMKFHKKNKKEGSLMFNNGEEDKKETKRERKEEI